MNDQPNSAPNQDPQNQNSVPPAQPTPPPAPTPPAAAPNSPVATGGIPSSLQSQSAPAMAETQATKAAAEQREGAIVLDIADEKAPEKIVKVQARSLTNLYEQINLWVVNLSGIKLEEKLLFFQLLGAMINAGLPILDALNLLKNQTKNAKMKLVIGDMQQKIEEGESLAASMRVNEDVFDEATCSVIEAGEKSGKLNEIMKELVAQYEQLNTLTKKFKSVMTYPVIVIVFMALLTVVVLIFVVPKLEELFGGSDQLPLPTQILINGSDFMLNYWIYVILGLVTSFFAFKKWTQTRSGAKTWNTIVLKSPVFGSIIQNMILTRVTRIFGFLITAGVPVVESLKIASHIAENELYQEKLLLAADDLTKGISIAENLSDDEKLFPKMLVNMMAIGEKTASLDSVMGKAADFYNDELERKIGGLSKMMEPVIMTFIAAGAVFMILAIYLPILQMNDKVLG